MVEVETSSRQYLNQGHACLTLALRLDNINTCAVYNLHSHSLEKFYVPIH